MNVEIGKEGYYYVSKNGIRYDLSIEGVKEMENNLMEKIDRLEKEVKELREALLIATRGKKETTKDIKVSMSTFYNLTQEILRREDDDIINMEDDIYGHDVTVHFHGLYCNCQDGAAAFNYVIEAVDACASEEEV